MYEFIFIHVSITSQILLYQLQSLENNFQNFGSYERLMTEKY